MAKQQIPNNFEAEEDFDTEILNENVIDREYAKSGGIGIAQNNEKTQVDRVQFDYSQINLNDIEEESDEVINEEGELIEGLEETQTMHNEGLSPEEVALNKKVQNKIAKSQSKNIINVYCFLLVQSIRWSCTINEEKLYASESRNEIDLSVMIGNLPLIQHIKNGNEAIRNIIVDEDSREAMQEALEIYMTSMNIQTSPGVNLAIALGTPAVTLFMDAFQQKRSMKTLIQASMETHALAVKKNAALQNKLNEEADRNAQLMAEMEAMKQQIVQSQNTQESTPKTVSKAEEKSRIAKKPIITNTGETPKKPLSKKQQMIEQNS